jgi:hypothetical protein
MRLFITVMLLMVVPMTLREVAVPAAASESSEKVGALYDPNPAHIWNRLYDALLIREGPTGAKYGADSLDPLLWRDTKHLLAQPSHARALRVLDQFLQTNAEVLIQDSLKRAIFQRDLWALFDWSVQWEPGSFLAPVGQSPIKIRTLRGVDGPAGVRGRAEYHPKNWERSSGGRAQGPAPPVMIRDVTPHSYDWCALSNLLRKFFAHPRKAASISPHF